MTPTDARPAGPATLPLGVQYLFAGLASQVVLFVALSQSGAGPLAVFPSVVGGVGLVMRWTATPVIVLMLLAYFLVYPTGVPLPYGQSDIMNSHFRAVDMLFVAAVVVYFASHYRMLSLRYQAVPRDPEIDSDRLTVPVVRPSTATFEAELLRLALVVAVSVGVGQVVWFLVCQLAVDVRAFPPVRVVPEHWVGQAVPWPPGFTPAAQRLVLFTGLSAVVGAVVWFGLWYWRLAKLTHAEARMCLLDTVWREGRRELNRQAKWRAWATGRCPRTTGWRDFRDALVWVLWMVLAMLTVVLVAVALRLFDVVTF